MFIFALLVICLEVYSLLSESDVLKSGTSGTEVSSTFVYWTIGFFFFYSVLQHVFEIFVSGKSSAVFSILPAILLFFLLRNTDTYELQTAVVISVILRLMVVFIPSMEKIAEYGVLALDAAAVYMYFVFGSFRSGEFVNILMFIILTIMTLSIIQKLIIERKKDGFPIYIFLIIGLFMAVIPVSEDPIDWTPVVEVGERLSERALETVDRVSYFFSDLFGIKGFSSGYSTLGSTGGNVGTSERTQLILSTIDKPYFVYTDTDGITNMKRRRTVYLEGGQGADIADFVSFANLLHTNDVDKEYASLFAKRTSLSIEYSYLKTSDEIAPINSFLLTNKSGKIDSGKSLIPHKKGYSLDADYLDIDYGSPYLIELIKNAHNDQPIEGLMTYDECSEYVSSLWGINLSKVLTQAEYEQTIAQLEAYQSAYAGTHISGDSASSLSPYLDTTGASIRMQDLAKELTNASMDPYEKCRIIESYLRQYAYNTGSAADKNNVYDLSTANGISQMADSFLFERGSGYCVHFASSMVMLLRLSGIPAKLANGYRYVFPFEKQDTYKVTGAFAHAWPVVYLEGIGWMPFEPTPAFLTAQERSWNKTISTAPATNYAPIYEEVPRLPETIVEEKEPPRKRVLSIASVIIPVVASILLLLLLLIFGSSIIDKLRYHHGSNEKKLQMDVEQIKKSLRRLSAEGFVDRGLLSDYVHMAPSPLRDDIQKVFGIYYRQKYSGLKQGITPQESALAKAVREEVLRLSGQNS